MRISSGRTLRCYKKWSIRLIRIRLSSIRRRERLEISVESVSVAAVEVASAPALAPALKLRDRGLVQPLSSPFLRRLGLSSPLPL